MTERRQLLAALDRFNEPTAEFVLATVVKVEGSAYRRPGARMLIPRYGGSVGTLSGGCLESEVSKKAWWLTEAGQAVVCRYSTASLGNDGEPTDDDALKEEAELQFGLGCNGTVHVLLQRLPATAPLFQLLRQVEQGRAPAAQALVIGKRGDWRVNVGDCVAIGTGNQLIGGIADSALTTAVTAELAEILASGTTRLLRYQADQAELELLLEYLPPPPELLVVGAGHDTEPLVRLAALLGWRVTVIDGRRHFARPERFPDAADVLYLTPADAAVATLPKQAAVVVMSHSFSQDRDWLRHFVGQSLLYLGQLGPKSRTDRLLGELAESTDPALRAALAALHAPVGLDLGGSTPEAVALAILAEVQAAVNGRQGGSLKHRTAPIHQAEVVSIRPWPIEAR